MSNLHNDSVVIDGLIIAKWDRSIFEDMRRGGLSAANCTVSVWEGFQDTVNNIADMKKLIRENGELVSLVRTTQDILDSKKRAIKPASCWAFRMRMRLKTTSAISKPMPTWGGAGSAALLQHAKPDRHRLL
ncbi:hypothetical protein ACFS07_05835 [Undibacterium arcticum]